MRICSKQFYMAQRIKNQFIIWLAMYVLNKLLLKTWWCKWVNGHIFYWSIMCFDQKMAKN